MEVGDLVREKTRMQREPEMGIILAVDYTQRGGLHPYQVYFFDGETNWMRDGFLEVIGETS